MCTITGAQLAGELGLHKRTPDGLTKYGHFANKGRWRKELGPRRLDRAISGSTAPCEEVLARSRKDETKQVELFAVEVAMRRAVVMNQHSCCARSRTDHRGSSVTGRADFVFSAKANSPSGARSGSAGMKISTSSVTITYGSVEFRRLRSRRRTRRAQLPVLDRARLAVRIPALNRQAPVTGVFAQGSFSCDP